MADVVDEDGNWSGKIDYFVQTGDIVDRCALTCELVSAVSLTRRTPEETTPSNFTLGSMNSGTKLGPLVVPSSATSATTNT